MLLLLLLFLQYNSIKTQNYSTSAVCAGEKLKM